MYFLSHVLQEKKKISFSDFEYEGDRHNRLLMTPDNKYFCQNCLYILAVVAQKHTESSLFLGDS